MRKDKYKGKTARATHNIVRPSKFCRHELPLTRYNGVKYISNNLYEVKNTIIDYGLSFMRYNGSSHRENIYESDHASIDKNKAWNIASYFSQNGKVNSRNRYNKDITIRLELPVIETRMVKLENNSGTLSDINKQGWFKHGNKLYNPDLIYIRNGDDFKEWKTNFQTPPNTIKLSSGYFNDQQLYHTLPYIFSVNPEQSITHLVFYGQSPDIEIYPPQKIQNKYGRFNRYKNLYNLDNKDNKNSYIRIANNVENLAYTTSVYIEYFDLTIKRWLPLGTFNINTSATENIIIDLYPFYKRKEGFFTTQFRFFPKHWVRHHMLRVECYGQKTADNKDNKDKNKKGNDKSSEMVSYDLIIKPKNKWLHDGIKGYGNYYFSTKFDRKREQLRTKISEGIDIYKGI